MTRQAKATADPLEAFPPLPLAEDHWQAIVEAMKLSPQQARIVELVLRGMCDKQIAGLLGIRQPTLRTHLQRISARTRTHGRMELAMRVLGLSHTVSHDHDCHRK